MKNRRDFLKETTFLCGGMLIGGAMLTAEGCKTKPVATATTTTNPPPPPTALSVVDGKVKVPVADLKDVSARVITVDGASPILINKNTDGTYTALEFKCPHKGGPLVKQGEELVCPWHDSRFKLDGDLIKGPAIKGLTHYPATVEGTEIVVKVS